MRMENERNDMTSLERVKTALEHKEPDRVPLDIGGALVAGINVCPERASEDPIEVG